MVYGVGKVWGVDGVCVVYNLLLLFCKKNKKKKIKKSYTSVAHTHFNLDPVGTSKFYI